MKLSRWLPPIGLALLLLIAVSYRATWSSGFVQWDDDVYVTENPLVQSGLSSEGIAYAFTTFDSGNYIPITWLSLELDSTIAGMSARWFHLVSVGMHWLNSLLVFVVVWHLTARWERSLFVAALFAVHPLHVESVAWISERKDVLSTCFLLLSILAWIHYAGRPGVGRYLLVALLMTLGLLSKSMLVTLPVLLLLVDVFLLDRAAMPTAPGLAADRSSSARQMRFLVLEKIPLLGLSLACGVLTLLAQKSAGAFAFGQPISLSDRLSNALVSTAWYVVRTVWPTGLSPFYPHETLSIPLVLASTGLLVIITVVVCFPGPQRRVAVFGWFWFLVALAPVIGIVQVGAQARADRYAYVPHLGLMMMLTWLVGEALARLRTPRRLLQGLGVAAITAMVMLTSRQVVAWHDTESLWRQALKVDPQNELAHYNLANTIARTRGPQPESFQHLQAVLDAGRHRDMAYFAMGCQHQDLGQLNEAAEHYRLALQENSRHLDAWRNLAEVAMKLGDQAAAQACLERLTTLEPNSAEAWRRRGLLEARGGKSEQAIASFERALQLNPNNWGAQTNLGLALWQAQRLPDALKHLEAAVELAPEHPNAHVNLADAAAALGNLQKAVHHYRIAVELNPEDQDARQKLRRATDELK